MWLLTPTAAPTGRRAVPAVLGSSTEAWALPLSLSRARALSLSLPPRPDPAFQRPCAYMIDMYLYSTCVGSPALLHLPATALEKRRAGMVPPCSICKMCGQSSRRQQPRGLCSLWHKAAAGVLDELAMPSLLLPLCMMFHQLLTAKLSGMAKL